MAHLAVVFNWDRKPLINERDNNPADKFPDEWVIRGNHHDAWVNVVRDPVKPAPAPNSKKPAHSASF